MNKNLFVVSVNDGKKVRILPTQFSSSGSSKSEMSDEPDSLSDLDEVETSSQACEETEQTKKKRQRLTHLTNEEKMMRRKLKNRVAAQSARDRKKQKMDELEELAHTLQEQNLKLQNENTLLKEKARLLLDENRKLLKFKSEVEQKRQDNHSINQVNCVTLKRKSIETFNEAEESAVFSNYASQPKSQLQGMFQRILCVLIFHTLSLISQETFNCQPGSSLKIVKLRAVLVKLANLLKHHQKKLALQQTPKRLIYRVNKYSYHELHKTMSACKLVMFVSLMVRSIKRRSSSRRFF